MADVITRLKLESAEYDNKIKRATQGLIQMEQECRRVGGSLAVLEKDQKEFVQSLGRMQTVSNSVRGQLGELTSAYTELAVQYKRLTDEEKKGDFGRALSSSLAQIKQRISETKGQLAEVQKELNGSSSKFGQFGGIIDTIGQKMGVTGNLTELLTSRTAMLTAGMGAAVAVIGKATDEWMKYNAELARQDQITQVTTGLKGPQSDKMTDQARAIVDTYGADFREVINAANTLMTQFGKTGDDAMRLISDGMQGMIQGDAPKLLSMIQQYAPSFRDAGIAADQLVAIIHNSEGGIFTDANMNAIVMGIKNIRLMTKATSEALRQVGIDGQEMASKLTDGSMTIFDALKQVATAIDGTASGSQAAGNVMQQVFGRQGAMAGTKLGEAIATLNLNLEETKRQTGNVGQAYRDLQTANERLSVAIRECFGYKGWEEMATGLKSRLYSALSDVLEITIKIKNSWVGDVGSTIFGAMTSAAMRALGPLGNLLATLKDINKEKNGTGGSQQGAGYNDIEKQLKYIAKGTTKQERQTRYDKAIADLHNKLNRIGQEKQRTNADGSTSFYIDSKEVQGQKRQALEKRISMLEQQRDSIINKPVTKPVKPLPPDREPSIYKATPPRDKDEFTEIVGLIANAEERVADLNRRIREAPDETVISVLRDQLAEAQQELDRLMGKGDGLGKMLGGVPQAGVPSATRGSEMEVAVRADVAFDKESADLNALHGLVDTVVRNGIEGIDIPSDELMEQIVGDGLDIPDNVWQDLADKINEKLKGLGIDPITIDLKTGKVKEVKKDADAAMKSFQSAAGAVGQVGSALQQIEDPAAKVFGIIAQAIANVAAGFAGALARPESQTGGIWGWIAAAAAGTATMISTIAAIHSATGYSEGGIVKGNSYSGDNIMANGGEIWLDSGEVVLNRAQLGNLASQLQEAGGGGLHIVGMLKGENIVLAANRYYRRTGQGEIVTW